MALLQAPRHHAQKQTPHAAEQDRLDILTRRQAWFEAQIDLDPLLRAVAERTVDALWDRIGHLLDRFSLQEWANDFAAAGYDAT